jgi:uncharacterized protein
MSFQSQLDQDLTTSMKEGMAARTAVLRLLKTSLKNEQIKQGAELTDEQALKVIQREAKQRRDSIDQYTKGDRADLATAEQAELDIIQTYLPEQMGEAELAQIVDSVIAETGATGPGQMGVVIGSVMKQVAGKADGAAVSALVRQKLAG